VFIDGPEQVEAYFQQLRPVPDAYRQYLPDASRLDRLPSYGGFGLLVLPMPDGCLADALYFRRMSCGESVEASIARIVSRTHSAFMSPSSLGKSFSSFSK
jgi:hypothetical protein